MTAVVSTYNRRENLVLIVEALLSDPATTELVVVVDGCRDGSLELLESLAVDQPRLRPLFIENSGTSAAHQTGVEHATGEIVLLLDDDVLAAPRLVTGHACHHAQRENLVVLGYMPTSVPRGRRPGDFTTRLYAAEYERCCELYERDPDAVLANLWGGNISIRRRDCLRVPLFTEAFPERYHEDQDWGIRCLKAGLDGVFDRSLLAHHAHARPVAAFRIDARREGAGRVRIYLLHGDVAPSPPTFTENLPPPLAALVSATRARPVYAVTAPLLAAAVRLLGRLRLFRLEELAGRILRRVEQQRGAETLYEATEGRSAPVAGRS